MMEGLSINSVDITNEDILVTYTPSLSTIYYSYDIKKDGAIVEHAEVNYNDVKEFLLSDSGAYQLIITEYDKKSIPTVIESGTYKIDKEPPKITIANKSYKIYTNDKFNYLDGISVIDDNDGDLTNSLNTNISDIDFSKEGIKEIGYSVKDSAGNVVEETVYVTVVKDNTSIIRISQLSLLIVFIVLLTVLFKYVKSIKFERRFSKYSLSSTKNTNTSLFDILHNKYLIIVEKFGVELSKSSFFTNISNKYDKYVVAFDLKNSMQIIANKIFVGVIYLLTLLILQLINSKVISPSGMILPFLVGYYTLDIIYIYRYMLYKKKIENDFLDAITVMNNAFKSGRSIIQAIDSVATELNGPISKEFKKISMELSFGLDIEVAFKRFADRIKLNDAVYLTSSLSVLSKTGGNIIKVFDSIEKTLFNRKKLQLELKSLTSSSRFIMYVLIFVPIAFIVLISIINKDYFAPLFKNELGLFLMGIMFIIYVAYIIVVKKVMKVRM